MAMIVALIDRPVHDAAWAPAMWEPGLPGQGHQNAHLGQLLDVAARSSIWNALHVIIWVNGAFGSGKTTLTEQLLRVLPESMKFDPEYIGYILTRWVPAADSGDFQDLPVWRRLVS